MATSGKAGEVKKRVATIGVVAVTAIIMGNMIGAGIFTIPQQIAAYGWWGIVAFVFTAIGALLLGLVFASLARRIPKTGGPYAYTRAAFGDFAGYWIAWGYWIGLWTGQVAIAVTFANYVGVFIKPFATSLLWNGALAIGIVWVVTALNLRGVKTAGSVAIVTTVIRVLPLLAIATVGWLYFHPGNFATTLPAGNSTVLGPIGAAAVITLFSFLGLESGTVPAGNVRDPGKTIPRATVIGILAVAVLYIVSTTVVMGVMPAATLTSSTASFADAGRVMWGDAGYYAVAFAGVVSTLGALSGFTLLNGQVPFAAAADRLFPSAFARENRFGAPGFGIVASSVLVTAMMLILYAYASGKWQGAGAQTKGIANVSILLATLTTVLPYAFCSVAELILVLTNRDFNGRGVAKLLVIPTLAFLYSLYMMYGSGPSTITAGFFLMLIGLPVYALLRRSNMKRGQDPDPKHFQEGSP